MATHKLAPYGPGPSAFIVYVIQIGECLPWHEEVHIRFSSNNSARVELTKMVEHLAGYCVHCLLCKFDVCRLKRGGSFDVGPIHGFTWNIYGFAVRCFVLGYIRIYERHHIRYTHVFGVLHFLLLSESMRLTSWPLHLSEVIIEVNFINPG